MTQVTERGHYLDVSRHPNFDLYWHGDDSKGIPEHQSTCCKLARAGARKINGDWRDCLGPMVILMNKALYSYDPERGPFAKYFGNLAVRHLIHYFTKRDSLSVELGYQHVTSSGRCRLRSVYRVEDWSDELAAAEECDNNLPEWDELVAPLNRQERQVVTLRYRDGCSYDEIGERMGRSRGAVNQLLFNARTKVREAM